MRVKNPAEKSLFAVYNNLYSSLIAKSTSSAQMYWGVPELESGAELLVLYSLGTLAPLKKPDFADVGF